MRTRFAFRLTGIILAALLLSACGRNDETPTPALGQVTVDSLQVTTLESFPVQVQAMVSGNLSDNCTSLAGINPTQQGTSFILELQTTFFDTGACARTAVPFSNLVDLNATGLPAGTYTVFAGNASQTFTLAVDNVAQAVPDATNTTNLTTSVTTTLPGQTVTLTGQGFPANSNVNLSVGISGGTLSPIAAVQTGADGRFSTQLNLPANAIVGEQWVFSALINDVPTYTNPILISSAEQIETITTETTETTESEANTMVNGQISKTNLYFIALQDDGQNGSPVGCGDSIVPVAIDLDEPTVAPMTAAYTKLLAIKDQNHGQTGYYNALYQSSLSLDSIRIVNREAIVYLKGSIVLAGECDSPRVLAQLEQVALQYSTVGKVTIYLEGRLLTQRTEPGGRG